MNTNIIEVPKLYIPGSGNPRGRPKKSWMIMRREVHRSSNPRGRPKLSEEQKLESKQRRREYTKKYYREKLRPAIESNQLSMSLIVEHE